MNDQEFEEAVRAKVNEKLPDFSKSVNIAVVGKVSSGKSSLINAILDCDRQSPCAKVGAESGVTTKISWHRLDDSVLLVDCPGLADVRQENSKETENFLDSVDVGIFVVNDSSDSGQKANFDDLRTHCKKTLVVLNKIDIWDHLEESELEKVVNQWKLDLGADHVYLTCTKGFDPKARKDRPMDIRGVDELRDVIFEYLDGEGKSILLAKHLKDKSKIADKIIATAVATAAAEAFLPGGGAIITATQLAAIATLNYVYKGVKPNTSSLLALLPTFVGRSVGTNLFLWAATMVPTGAANAVGAGVAAVVTFAMLAAVKKVLETGFSLDDKDRLGDYFESFKKLAGELKELSLSDLKPGRLAEIIGRLISGAKV